MACRSALVALPGLHLARDLLGAESARHAAGELGCEVREDGARAEGQGGDVDLAAVALDRADRRLRDILGRACSDPARKLDFGVREHSRVADEAREHGRYADTAA